MLELTTSPRTCGSLYWKMVFRNQDLCARFVGIFIASEVLELLGPIRDEGLEIHVHTYIGDLSGV